MKLLPLALLAAGLAATPAPAKRSDACAAPIRAGDTFAIRDVTTNGQVFGNDQIEIHACVVTNDPRIATVDVFFATFPVNHSPIHEDGQSNLRLAASGYTGRGSPRRMVAAAGSPTIVGAVAALRVLAVVTWTDVAMRPHWEGYFVPLRIVPTR